MAQLGTSKTADPRPPAVEPGIAPEVATPRATSLFVNGVFPRRPGLVVLLSALGGFLLTVVWSAEVVDSTIGDTVANGILGHDAKETPIAGIVAGIVFAFVTGLAGTFTACNVAVFGAVGPLVSGAPTRRARVWQALKPIGWLAVGIIPVSAAYGALVAIVGTSMPQFSTASGGTGLSPRSVQSMVVFGIIGLAMSYLGLAALGVVRDPLAGIARRYPHAPLILVGVLIGGFLIGRPYPLFRALFRDAAESGNPFYGASAFVLQSLGNIVVMAILFIVISYFAGSRIQRWIAAKPARAAVLTGAAFLVAGVFTFLYWDVRLLARREIIWYPVAPWG